MTVNHEFIDRFKAEHGHPPWVTCGDPEYRCLVEGDDGPRGEDDAKGRVGDHADS